MGRAVAPGCFQLVEDLSIAGHRQAFCGDRRSRYVTAETLQLVPFMCPGGGEGLRRTDGQHSGGSGVKGPNSHPVNGH